MTTRMTKVTFAGSQGHALAARLDRPAGPPRAYALFAHCFTCSKDIFAASRIAAALAERGIAVLRFDFTGLGMSGGEFANTDFSSNVADLVAAADFLRGRYRAPTILIGHSLGGAAVLAAAQAIPEATAVVTIAAPADAEHVIGSFAADVSTIEATGKAEVTLAGRRFTIRRALLEDLREQRLTAAVAELRRALLILHAPGDVAVGIENASKIFRAAKHPKSFVSLDDADHLLSRRSDAVYVAEVLSAWASRYLPPEDAPEDAPEYAPAPADAAAVTVTETGNGRFQQLVRAGDHRLVADEPVAQGGLGSGPSPYDFLSVALGACTAMTLRMYADRKGLDLGRISVAVDHAKVHARDCEACAEGRTGQVDRFLRTITIEDGLDPALQAKILEIAGKCPVHRTLEQGSVVVTSLAASGTGLG